MPKPKFLAIEESVVARKDLQDLFGAHYSRNELVRAADAQEALERLDAEDFRLVVLDLVVPGMNVAQLIEKIRSREKYAAVPIMVFGESDKKEEIVSAIRAGADDFLFRSCESWVIRERIRFLFTGMHKGRELLDEQIEDLPDPLAQVDIDRILWPMLNESMKPTITYDFRHPTQVSKLQLRMLENLHANLARMMASSFSNLQRSVVDVDIAYLDQTTYAEFIMSLANPSCSYTFTIDPLGGPAILDFAIPIVGPFIDREFGGEGRPATCEPHPLTAIERSVMARCVTRTLADLEATWAPMIKIQITDAELETNPEFMQVAAPSDTVILIAFEVNSQHSSGLVSLCYPYLTLEPVFPYLSVQSWASRSLEKHRNRQDRLLRLKKIPAEIRLVWGRGEVAAADLASVKEGDTIVLQTRTGDPSIVYLEDQPLFLARAGAGTRGCYAAEVLEALPPVDCYDPLLLEGRHNV